MMVRVVILDKPDDSWSEEESAMLVSAGVEVSILDAMPKRLVALNNPRGGQTFQEVLGHFNFIARQVPYADRWKQS